MSNNPISPNRNYPASGEYHSFSLVPSVQASGVALSRQAERPSAHPVCMVFVGAVLPGWRRNRTAQGGSGCET